MWLPYAPNSSWPSYDCITIAAHTNYTESGDRSRNLLAPPRRWFQAIWLDVTKGALLSPALRLDRWSVTYDVLPASWWNIPPTHSSVGLPLFINTAESFRRITFRRKDWTMVNMSYHQPLLKHPHSTSQQSGRRAAKRKRVSWRFLPWVWRVFLTPGREGVERGR